MQPRIVDAPRLPAYDLGRDHPFARDRQQPLFDLLDRLGWIDPDARLLPEPADDALLQTAHTAGYIECVRDLSVTDPDPAVIQRALLHGFGNGDNPIAPGLHASAAAVAGATAACVEEVLSGRTPRAFNPAGGLHHAMPDAASGFCVYNDLVVGIRRARALGAARVVYIDFDVHHGDGVEHAFVDDPSVLTISFHEDPDVRWPCTGRITDRGRGAGHGTVIDVPLASFTDDASWLAMVRAVLVPAIEDFAPELIVSQHGCDPHREDPLAELHLTTRPMYDAALLTRELADRVCGGRWVATGGGGYQPYRVIPRAWSLVWAAMTDRTVPAAIDPAWIEAWQERAGTPLPGTFFDDAIADRRHAHAARINERTLADLAELLAK